MCREIRPPLPIHKQLSWLQKPQVFPFIHSVLFTLLDYCAVPFSIRLWSHTLLPSVEVQSSKNHTEYISYHFGASDFASGAFLDLFIECECILQGATKTCSC